MQVPMTFINIIIYKKSKKSRRLVRGHQPPRRGGDEIVTRAHCLTKTRWTSIHSNLSLVQISEEDAIEMTSHACLLQCARGRLRPGLPKCLQFRGAIRGEFFDFIYVNQIVIGTCMQIFKKMTSKKTRLFSVKAVVHCFWHRLYLSEHERFIRQRPNILTFY